MFNKNTVLVSVGIIYKEEGGKKKWLAVKKASDGTWEFPRITVRKTESSARAGLRMAGEQLGANTQILEEVGRSGGLTNVNGRSISQRQLYYLMRLKNQGGEVLGFVEQAYFDYAQAVKKLSSKRDAQMLKAAREELKKLIARKDKKLFSIEEEEEEIPIEVS